MSLTAIPESRRSLAVPPVEISSTPISESLRAKSAKPVLSVTLGIARWILWDIQSLKSGNFAAEGLREFYQLEQAWCAMTNRLTTRHGGAEKSFYVLARAVSFTLPSAISTEYSTCSQPYCFLISFVFF